ncbi:MAG: hypothetical protein IPH09_13175 [bacterium]|nr:hypothetical protein [bacterium]
MHVELADDPRAGYIDPTTGTDYKIIVYRTKGDGDTYYRLREIASADLTSFAAYFSDATKDTALGAAWLYDTDANDPPPAATLGCICQQIMFLAGVSGYETNLYRSRISGYDYYKPTDYVDVEARITALASMADRVVVFTQDRIGTYSPIDEIGQFAWSLSPVGTDQDHGICVTEMGVLFARSDGLWLFDGVTSRNLTEHITSEWEARNSPTEHWSVARTPDLVVCCSPLGKLVASTLGGNWKWSVGGDIAADRVAYACSSADGITLYGLIQGDLYTLFATGQRTLSVTTKDYGGWKTWEGLQLDVDAYCAGNDFTATVTTNHGESEVISFTGMVRRNRYRAMLPANLRGEYINVKFDGQVTIYGWEILAQ